MSKSYDPMLDEAYHGHTASELLEATVDALKGVSSMDAEKLADAFPIERLRDLAEWKFAERARAIRAATGIPGFDPGPPPALEAFFHDAPLAHYQSHPDRFRLPFGPVYYRGRLDDTARVVVVGQDPATDEILAHRTFVGFSGQRVQGFLRKLGLTRSYVMMNTFLIGVFGQFDSELRATSLEAPILDYRNAFLTRLSDRNPVEAVIAVGGGARHAIEQWPGRDGVPVFQIQHPAALDEAPLLATWNEALLNLAEVVEPDDDGTTDLTPYGSAFTPEDNDDIPRFDLPFGVPDWQGRGPHSVRDGNKKIIWTAP
jgi:uracil-DNA glycosylase